VIGGEALRGALRLALLLVGLSLVTLLFQERSSAESVVAVMALVVSLAFLVVVLVVARFGTARLPARRDSERRTEYNTERVPRREHRRGP